MTREDWLNAMVARLHPHFAAHGATIPERLRVSIGFPSKGGLSIKRRTAGEHWGEACSASGHHEIFINPVLGQAEAVSTLAHELCHACLPAGTKHKAPFKRLGLAIGLEGKPTSMGAGPELAATLADLGASIGPWPASCLNASSLPKAQGTRLIKAECAEGSGYCVRITRKWLDETGAPICPCHNEPMMVQEQEQE